MSATPPPGRPPTDPAPSGHPTSTGDPVRWGLPSTAIIGATVVAATRGSRRTRFTAVASRDGARVRAFAERHGLPTGHGSYRDLLASDQVDAVCVALAGSPA